MTYMVGGKQYVAIMADAPKPGRKCHGPADRSPDGVRAGLSVSAAADIIPPGGSRWATDHELGPGPEQFGLRVAGACVLLCVLVVGLVARRRLQRRERGSDRKGSQCDRVPDASVRLGRSRRHQDRGNAAIGARHPRRARRRVRGAGRKRRDGFLHLPQHQQQVGVRHGELRAPDRRQPCQRFRPRLWHGAGALGPDNRVYRISSPSEWALATLIDNSGQLPTSQVPKFQGVTHALLQNAKGYGHSCSLVTKPTTVASKVYFDILVAGANIKDTFYASSPNQKGVRRITQISPLTNSFQVQTSKGQRQLTIQLTKGIDYRAQTGTRPVRSAFASWSPGRMYRVVGRGRRALCRSRRSPRSLSTCAVSRSCGAPPRRSTSTTEPARCGVLRCRPDGCGQRVRV